MKRIVLIFLTTFLYAQYTNELIYEESPYLKQHAHNPVHWLPWGEKAFKKAKREHKPIFLSIGYSTCHWCHVMERESFENEEIAKLLNDYYIPIKVDREERPDLDSYYQKVYQVMHRRSGGWPLTIIMSEDRKPFFAATYLPPEDGYGVKGMKTILPLLAKAYKSQRAFLERRADAVLKLVSDLENAMYVPVQLDLAVAKKFVDQTKKIYDERYKGFSKQIKFPEASRIRVLLDIYLITKEKSALDMAIDTLKAMAQGGIYDQVDGAFFRYTTDRKWQIPHYEKMLYTNAELIDVYTRAYKITKEPLFKRIVQDTIKEIDRRFGIDKLYASASDAETKGEEGGFFLYDYGKTLHFFLRSGVKKPKAIKELAYYGIEEDGNVDGELSNSHINEDIKLSQEEKEEAKKLLSKIRQKRSYPFIDKKIITAWNAMYIDAKMRAFFIDPSYKDEALQSLDRLLEKLYRKGVLYHYYLPPNNPQQKGLFEDYSYLIKALITAYEYSLQKKYLTLAQKLIHEAKEKFFKRGKWYLSDQKISAVASISDAYYTAPLSVMIENYLKFTALTYDQNYLKEAKRAIDSFSALLFHSPSSYPEATRAFLRLKIGDVIIKHKKEVLLKRLKEILSIAYPYTLIKDEKIDRFEVCRVDSCFLESASFEQIKKSIEEFLIPTKKRVLWR